MKIKKKQKKESERLWGKQQISKSILPITLQRL